MNTVQIVKHQRDLLSSIATDIADVEQMAGRILAKGVTSRLLANKISQIKDTATTGIVDEHINAVILDGYKQDCLDSLLGLQRLVHLTVVANEEDGEVEPSDEQLQHLAMAARNYTDRVESYLQLMAGMAEEEING